MSPTRLFALCLSLCACKSGSVDDVVGKQRPAVEKTFAAIRALASAPESTATQLDSPAVPLFLEKPASDADNALFIYAEDLTNPGAARPVALRTLDTLPLAHCGALLSGGRLFGAAEKLSSTTVATGYLTACARVRFVLVIRGREFMAPISDGTKKFGPGRYQADVQVFDLATGKSLGSFPVAAQNDPDVTVVAGEDQEQRLLRNLEGAIYKALREGARKAFPGSLP